MRTAAGRVVIHLGLDQDDPSRDRYVTGGSDDLKVRVTAERMTLSEYVNQLMVDALQDPDVDIVGFMGDDHRPRTNGWDSRIRAAMAALGPGGGLVYCADGFQNEKLPTAAFFPRGLLERLGKFCPHHAMDHMYLDDYWLALGRAIGRVAYLDDVMIEHCHPIVGKAETDRIYEASAAKAVADQHAWNLYRAAGKFAQDARAAEAWISDCMRKETGDG